MTRDVNSYTSIMGRWQPGARDRLERAALELFLEQGFAQTTVPQITARAGLTTRTFFRHFTDKREVLFASEEDLPALVEKLMSEAPVSLSPMAVIAYGLKPFAATAFVGRAEFLRMRHAVITANEGLRERELRKRESLAEAISQGFRRRGADELTALLAAELAMSVLRVALSRWLNPASERELAEIITETLSALHFVATDIPSQ